jgi:hypothetical protein
MSVPALDTSETAPAAPQSKKKDRIPKAVIRGCELIASGECKTITAAAERVGITREWLSKQMQRSHVQAFIAQRARQTIASGMLRASARVLELVDASSEHVSLDASKYALAVQGIRPPSDTQVAVNVGVSVGYVIDLSGKAAAGAKVIDHDS